MARNVPGAVVLTLLLAGVISTNAQRDHRVDNLDLLRFLATEPWAGRGHNRWDRAPRFDADMGDRFPKDRWVKPNPQQDDSTGNYVEDGFEGVSSKRSAVATVLNGRRRRQPGPAPALGKEVTPYVGVGVLNDVGSYFGVLRDNLRGMASQQRLPTYYPDAPSVVQASSRGGGGGSGAQRLHALRPLRPSGIRTYNRRSTMENDIQYPGANRHDPGLLWTGLGRR